MMFSFFSLLSFRKNGAQVSNARRKNPDAAPPHKVGNFIADMTKIHNSSTPSYLFALQIIK